MMFQVGVAGVLVFFVGAWLVQDAGKKHLTLKEGDVPFPFFEYTAWENCENGKRKMILINQEYMDQELVNGHFYAKENQIYYEVYSAKDKWTFVYDVEPRDTLDEFEENQFDKTVNMFWPFKMNHMAKDGLPWTGYNPVNGNGETFVFHVYPGMKQSDHVYLYEKKMPILEESLTELQTPCEPNDSPDAAFRLDRCEENQFIPKITNELVFKNQKFQSARIGAAQNGDKKSIILRLQRTEEEWWTLEYPVSKTDLRRSTFVSNMMYSEIGWVFPPSLLQQDPNRPLWYTANQAVKLTDLEWTFLQKGCTPEGAIFQIVDFKCSWYLRPTCKNGNFITWIDYPDDENFVCKPSIYTKLQWKATDTQIILRFMQMSSGVYRESEEIGFLEVIWPVKINPNPPSNALLDNLMSNNIVTMREKVFVWKNPSNTWGIVSSPLEMSESQWKAIQRKFACSS